MNPGDFDIVHVNVACIAGAHTVGNASFFRYVVRMADTALPLTHAEREAVEPLGAIPHAFEEEEETLFLSGPGWRVVPARGTLDWPVLEATPQRLRSAFDTARRVLWTHGNNAGVTAREVVAIDQELDAIDGVLSRAETAGVVVNVSYVA